ncbi:Ig-like V-type domain-containing protein FAM187A [Sebastes fasciatus]|uniref:Ig-like V-type domain-containing protein FAM187A n=1 Tax=Sebastes fasciatus TaxID=394691 RepID=UPI003D9E1311
MCETCKNLLHPQLSLMPPASSSPILLLLLFLLGCPEVWSYEAPEDRQDVFARRACPAFLTFTNAAYLSGVTLELPCHCKPSQIQSVVWFFRKHLGGSEVTRALTDYHGNRLLDPRRVPHSGDLRSRFSIRLFSLLIFRAGPDDSGIYICGSVHRDFFHAYDLDIQEARLSRFIPSSSTNTDTNTAPGRSHLSSGTNTNTNTAPSRSHLSSGTNTNTDTNTAPGHSHLSSGTNTDTNTASGRSHLSSGTNTDTNTASGRSHLSSGTNTDTNTAPGHSHLSSSTNTDNNTAPGRYHLSSGTNTDTNTAPSRSHLSSGTNTDTNTAPGRSHLSSGTNTDTNTAPGRSHLSSGTNTDTNTAPGRSHLSSGTNTDTNTAPGRSHLSSSNNTDTNTAPGRSHLSSGTNTDTNTDTNTCLLVSSRVKQRTNTKQTGKNIEAPYRAWSVCRRCDRDRNKRPEPLFQTFIGFQPWPVCDRCGVPGEQVRPGICYVDSRYLHPRYRHTNQSIASCGSGAVPWTLKQLKLRGSIGRLEVRSCQVTCQSQPPPSSSLRDLMAFLGYSSASRPVFHLNHPADRVLTLGCPGAQPNSAVAWDRGSQPIYRSQRWAGRDPDAAPIRLVVDSGNHLVFKPAKTEDSGVYYCWLHGHRAAEIHLLVYAHLGRGQSVTSHPDFPAALNTVLGGYAVMTAVFCLLVIGRAGVRLLRETHND